MYTCAYFSVTHIQFLDPYLEWIFGPEILMLIGLAWPASIRLDEDFQYPATLFTYFAKTFSGSSKRPICWTKSNWGSRSWFQL